MIRTSISAAVLALAVASPAMALTDPGFESGTGGWTPTIAGNLQALPSGSNVTVTDDGYQVYPDLITTIDAMAGNNFGLLSLTSGTQNAYSFNLAGPVSTFGDIFWLRLLSLEYEWDKYNDQVVVTYNGPSIGTITDTWSVADTYAAAGVLDFSQMIPDSGWKGFFVPVGTQSLMVQVNNVSSNTQIPGDSLYNRPIVALDYDAVTPVPEADATAMMLAGLGVLGMVARRRAKKTA